MGTIKISPKCCDEFLRMKHFSSEFILVMRQLFFGKLNKHNVRIWGSEIPHASRELQQNSPKSECLVWNRVQSSNWAIFL